MIQIIGNHEVEDVEHWFNSPVRGEFFEARGMKITPFRDPAGENKVTAVLIEAPDMETFQSAMQEPEAAAAQEHDRVLGDTLQVFVAD